MVSFLCLFRVTCILNYYVNTIQIKITNWSPLYNFLITWFILFAKIRFGPLNGYSELMPEQSG